MKVRNSILKIAFSILVIFTISIISMQPSYCDDHTGSGGTFGSSGSSGQLEKIDTNEYKPTQDGGDQVKGIANNVIGILQQIGSIISVIALIVLGIKYMAGSIEEKAQYKETMMPYVIGAVLVFATTNVLAVISNIFA